MRPKALLSESTNHHTGLIYFIRHDNGFSFFLCRKVILTVIYGGKMPNFLTLSQIVIAQIFCHCKHRTGKHIFLFLHRTMYEYHSGAT